jgi:hypothetical protein
MERGVGGSGALSVTLEVDSGVRVLGDNFLVSKTIFIFSFSTLISFDIVARG